MNRQQAIEAGARASFESRTGYSWDEISDRARPVWLREAALIIDAAASHLVGEPVGYALIAGQGAVRFPDLESARAARVELRMPSAGVVALVPVEDQP